MYLLTLVYKSHKITFDRCTMHNDYIWINDNIQQKLVYPKAEVCTDATIVEDHQENLTRNSVMNSYKTIWVSMSQ